MRLCSATVDRLYFAQVREDPLLEIETLQPAADRNLVVVSSGGCTALSLVARGAGHVVAVDRNITQNHLVELKAAAICSLDPDCLAGFLGAAHEPPAMRITQYSTLRPSLSYEAATYWDAHSKMIANGALNAGVSEQFIRIVVAAMRAMIHRSSRVDRLLTCRTLAEQRQLYVSEFNNRRWRLLFRALLSRGSFNRTYDSRFFENVENASFAAHFLALVEHGLCEIPVATNYFVHHMLRGHYPLRVAGGMPPYLDPATLAATREKLKRLELVDGGYAEYLATCDDETVDGFALSNICEWLDKSQIDELFAQVIRVAKPGAHLCFRNFVGHTDVPAFLRSVIREDVEAGREAILRDRSCIQSRIAFCTVEK